MAFIRSNLVSNQTLAPLSTFKIGGSARLFIEVKTPEQMVLTLQYIKEQRIPLWILGRGSNSLFDDRGFDGIVILNSIRFCHFEGKRVRVGAGYNFSLLGAQTARKGWSGLEFASGIPGSVGGAVFMNAGAGGLETSDSLKEVLYVDSNTQLVEKKKEELRFSYRCSSFHGTQAVIVGATFDLKPSNLAHKRQLVITKKRVATQPYGEPSAGCVFRNPSDQKGAGALIEECGLKGKRIGGAEVSLLHANFIVNKGNATALEVIELVELVRKTVYEKMGIQLELEIQPIPYKGKGWF